MTLPISVEPTYPVILLPTTSTRRSYQVPTATESVTEASGVSVPLTRLPSVAWPLLRSAR